ncbi:MAG: MarR family transcriptional regulator [Actinomycetota bacterium]
MSTPPDDVKELLNPDRLAPSAAVLGAYIAIDAVLGDDLARCGHERRTVDLLLRLATAPGHAMRAVDLAEQLLLSPSHVSRLIDRVEADGLVERRPDPADRRANQVVLTDAGWEVMAGVAPHMALTLDRVVHGVLSDEETATLVELLGRIEAAARVDRQRRTDR